MSERVPKPKKEEDDALIPRKFRSFIAGPSEKAEKRFGALSKKAESIGERLEHIKRLGEILRNEGFRDAAPAKIIERATEINKQPRIRNERAALHLAAIEDFLEKEARTDFTANFEMDVDALFEEVADLLEDLIEVIASLESLKSDKESVALVYENTKKGMRKGDHFADAFIAAIEYRESQILSTPDIVGTVNTKTQGVEMGMKKKRE